MTVQNHMIRSSTTKNRDSNMKRSNTTTSTTQEFYITTVGEWNQWNVKCFQIILNPVCIEILPCWMDRKIVTYLCFLYIAVHPIHAYHCSPWQVPFRNNAFWWWLIWVSLKIAYPQRKSMVYQQFSYEYSHVDPFSEVYPIFRPPIVGCKLALQCYVKKISHAFRHGEYCCADDAMQRDLAMVRSWAPEKSAALALCSIIRIYLIFVHHIIIISLIL